MPHVKITIENVECVNQHDRFGTDDVYWIRHIKCGPAIDPKYMDLTTIYMVQPPDFASSLPTMLDMASGQIKSFPPPTDILYENDCPFDHYVFGTMHLMEHSTPISDFIEKLLAWIGTILGLLATLVGGAILAGAAIAALLGGAVSTGIAWGEFWQPWEPRCSFCWARC